MTQSAPATVLALDYGIKKTGMALGNTLTKDAQPFGILAMDNGRPDWDNLLGIITSWQIAFVVVGLPLNMDGTDSMLSKRAAKFARRLAHKLGERHTSTRVYLTDERLTSREAKNLAWERGLIKNTHEPIDAIAACLIFGAFIEGNTTAVIDYHQQKNRP